MTDTLLQKIDSSVNLATIVQSIKEEIHRERTLDDNRIKRAICAAIYHYRGKRFHFNESSYSFLTVEDQMEYGVESSIGENDGYPQDLVRPDVLRLDRGNWQYPMKKISFNEVRRLSSFSITSGYPSDWSWHSSKIFLWPAPNTDDWNILIDYVKDIGTPVAKYSGGDWSYQELSTGNGVTDSWTSDWFTYAEEMIRSRAEWALYLSVYKDDDAASRAKELEVNARASLEGDSDNFHHVSSAVPWGI